MSRNYTSDIATLQQGDDPYSYGGYVGLALKARSHLGFVFSQVDARAARSGSDGAAAADSRRQPRRPRRLLPPAHPLHAQPRPVVPRPGGGWDRTAHGTVGGHDR